MVVVLKFNESNFVKFYFYNCYLISYCIVYKFYLVKNVDFCDVMM